MKLLLLNLCVLAWSGRIDLRKVSALSVTDSQEVQVDGSKTKLHPYATVPKWTRKFIQSGGTLGQSNANHNVELYILNELKFGKQPSYLVFLGGSDQLFEFSPGSKPLDGHAKDNSDSVNRWRRGPEGTLMTSVVNAQNNKAYFTFFHQNSTSMIKGLKNASLPQHPACKIKKSKKTKGGHDVEILQANYGDCKRATSCGPVAFVACGIRKNHEFSIFKVDKWGRVEDTPNAEVKMLQQKRSAKFGQWGKTKRQFEVSINAGSDPLLLSQFAIFIDLASNLEDKIEAKEVKDDKAAAKKKKSNDKKELKEKMSESEEKKKKKSGFSNFFR